jgi:opacity protein-like surface antigen
MTVTRIKISMLTLIAAMTAGTAQAADYQQPMPQQPIMVQPQEPDNWYLRGFVGVGSNGPFNLDVTNITSDTFFAAKSIDDSTFIGGGVGYNWNNWLRFDVTGEYRSKARIAALAVSQPGGAGPVAVDQYEATLNSWVFLANAYVDLGTWNCLTPFVGFGIGGAYNMISNFTDVTPNVDAFGATGSAFGIGRGTSNWSMAWALYAGVSYAMSKNLNIDLTYRYLNFGTAKDTIDCFGNTGCNEFTFKDLHSNDIMLSLRWTCCDFGPPAPPPPRYVYAPPPPPPPPPLQSRG